MNYLKQHPSLTAILINLVLFSGVFAFTFPIFNSGDDVYLMYLLSGGFGNAPTELLHYQYGMHPLIGLLVKNAFLNLPGLNWYAVLLYGFHFLSCYVVLLQSIKKNQLVAGVGYYLLFFVIELFFLLQPSFTNTAMVTSVAGLLLIYTGVQQKQNALRLLPGFALLLAAALLRLHILIPVVIIGLPFVIAVVGRKQSLRFLLQTGVLAVIIMSSFFIQRQYYIKHTPGWQQEELHRQTIIDHYNVPKELANTLTGDLKMRADFLEKGILWDTAFLSVKNIAATTASTMLMTAAGQNDFKQRLFWLLIESRMGILLMLMLFLLKMHSFNKAEKNAALSSAGLFVVLCALLILFRKLPGYVVTGGMLQWISFVIVSGKQQPKANQLRPVIIGAAIIISIWGSIRLHKLNQSNIGHYSYWRCAYTEVLNHKESLLIVTDDRFPSDYFHVWDLPNNYLLPNVLTKDHFLNNTYSEAFKRFGVPSLNDPAKVSFIGAPSETLEQYYEMKNGKAYDALPAPLISNCIYIWGLY